MSINGLLIKGARLKIISTRFHKLISLIGLEATKKSNLWRYHVEGKMWSGTVNVHVSFRSLLRHMTAEDIGGNLQKKNKISVLFKSENALNKIKNGINISKSDFYLEHTIPVDDLEDDIANQLLKHSSMNAKDIAIWAIENHVTCLLSKDEEKGLDKLGNKKYPFKRYPFKVFNQDGEDVSAWPRSKITKYIKNKYSNLIEEIKKYDTTGLIERQTTWLESRNDKHKLRSADWYLQSREKQFEQAYSKHEEKYIRNYFNYDN